MGQLVETGPQARAQQSRPLHQRPAQRDDALDVETARGEEPPDRDHVLVAQVP